MGAGKISGVFKLTIGGKAREVTLHMEHQGKHIEGHYNYREGRSKLTEDPVKLMKEIEGMTGQRIDDHKERFDIGRKIGEYYDHETNMFHNTTVVIVHIDENGNAHMSPARLK